MPLLTRRSTIELLRRHGLRPRTELGQHFLVDPNTIRKIVRLSRIAAGDMVLEIGAGIGALTIALAEAGASIVAIEQDRSLRLPLTEVLEPVESAVHVEWTNALEADYARLLSGRRTLMVSNLPYNIATPLLISLLEDRPEIYRYLVMVQREAGLRLVARPGEDEYGGVSVKIAYLARSRLVSKISRRVFLPEPAVESVLVELERRDAPPVAAERERLFAVVDAAFGQRRKTVRNALGAAATDPAAVAEALQRSGVSPGARAEELSLDEFSALALHLVVARS